MYAEKQFPSTGEEVNHREQHREDLFHNNKSAFFHSIQLNNGRVRYSYDVGEGLRKFVFFPFSMTVLFFRVCRDVEASRTRKMEQSRDC